MGADLSHPQPQLNQRDSTDCCGWTTPVPRTRTPYDGWLLFPPLGLFSSWAIVGSIRLALTPCSVSRARFLRPLVHGHDWELDLLRCEYALPACFSLPRGCFPIQQCPNSNVISRHLVGLGLDLSMRDGAMARDDRLSMPSFGNTSLALRSSVVR